MEETTTAPADRRAGLRWARLVLVLLLALGVALPVLAVVAWLRWAGGRFGWLQSFVVFGALGAGAAWLAISSRWPVARTRSMIGLAALFGLIGVVVAHTAPPTAGRLRHAIRELEEPGWQLVADQDSGNAMCFDSCTEVMRRYALSLAFDDAVARLTPSLERQHLHRVPGGGRGEATFDDDGRGDVELLVTIAPRDGGATSVEVWATTR